MIHHNLQPNGLFNHLQDNLSELPCSGIIHTHTEDTNADWGYIINLTDIGKPGFNQDPMGYRYQNDNQIESEYATAMSFIQITGGQFRLL